MCIQRTLLVVLLLSVVAGACASQAYTSPVPLSVSKVDTFRVGKNLVRVIAHNAEVFSALDIELIKAPGRAVIHGIEIDGVTLEGEFLDFSKSAAVEYDDFEVQDNALSFHLAYVVPRPSEWIDMTCTVNVENERLQAPQCVRWQSAE